MRYCRCWRLWVNLCSVASTGISRIGMTRRSFLLALPLALTTALAFAMAGFPAATHAQTAPPTAAQSSPPAAGQSATPAAAHSAQPASTADLPDAPGVAAAARTEPVPTGPTIVIDSTMGRLTCKTFDRQAPKAVANFIGLAEGTKEWTVTPPAPNNTASGSTTG